MAVVSSYYLHSNIIYDNDKNEESSESIMDIYIKRGREAFLKRKENGYSSSKDKKTDKTQTVEDSAIYRRLIESWKKRNFRTIETNQHKPER